MKVYCQKEGEDGYQRCYWVDPKINRCERSTVNIGVFGRCEDYINKSLAEKFISEYDTLIRRQEELEQRDEDGK